MVSDVQLELDCHTALIGADHVKARLLTLLSAGKDNIFDTYYAVKCRVKSRESLRKKVIKKRSQGKPDYQPNTATDLVGLRILTIYSSELATAALDFVDFIQVCQRPEIDLFAGNELNDAIREIIVYKPTTDTRFYQAAYEHLSNLPLFLNVDGSNKVRAEEPTEEKPYSSIHIVCETKFYQPGHIKTVPIEVQIRTVFEDAWNEVDHPIRYKSLKDQKSNYPAKLRQSADSIVENLKEFKTQLDTCGRGSDHIKERHERLLRSVNATDKQQKGRYKLFNPDQDIIPCPSTGFQDKNIKKELLDIVESIDSLSNTDPLSANSKTKLPESFAIIAELQELDNTYRTKDASAHSLDYDFHFSRDMLKNFVLTWQARTGTEARRSLKMREVISSYRRMEKDHSARFSKAGSLEQSSLLKFRLANAFYALKEWDHAISELSLGCYFIDSDSYLPELSKLRFMAPRQLAMFYWRKKQCLWHSNENHGPFPKSSAMQASLLKKALENTQLSLEKITQINSAKDEKNKTLVNAACYIWELKDITNRSVAKWMKTIPIDECEINYNSSSSLHQIDSFMKVQDLLGRSAVARKTAVAIMTRLETDPLQGITPQDDSRFIRYCAKKIRGDN